MNQPIDLFVEAIETARQPSHENRKFILTEWQITQILKTDRNPIVTEEWLRANFNVYEPIMEELKDVVSVFASNEIYKPGDGLAEGYRLSAVRSFGARRYQVYLDEAYLDPDEHCQWADGVDSERLVHHRLTCRRDLLSCLAGKAAG